MAQVFEIRTQAHDIATPSTLVFNGTNTGYTTIQASTNRATAVGGTSWGYDGAGDVTSIGTTTYAYDPLGMMTTLTAPAFTSYYFYTPDDERIWTKTGSGSS